MSLISKHDDYNATALKWQRCRDVVEGQDAIHEAGETYLPRIGEMTDEQYAAYVLRSRFFNASDRTVEGMLGLATRKATYIVPEDTVLEEDVNHQGSTASEYAANVLREILTVGRGGTLVDYPTVGGAVSVAAAEAANLTPLWAYYATENIYDWAFSFVNNVYQLTRVMLYDGVDTSGEVEVYKYRELLLVDGVYVQRLYEASNDTAEPHLVEEIIPTANGSKLPSIPFVFHNVKGKAQQVDKPPLLDLFDTNIKHYQLKADHLHALHYVALPTPYVTGVDKDEAPTSIGPQRIWSFSNDTTKIGMLEFSGQGVGAIRDELTSIETQMAQLGSRMLSPEANVAETATTTTIKGMAENSTLAGTINRVNAQMTRVWDLSLEWMAAATEDSAFQMSTDFMPATLSGADLIALVTTWQNGGISKETLFYNLQQGEIIPEENTFAEEEEAIASELPAAPATATGDVTNPFESEDDDA